jgi:hypothetical protein
MISKTTKNLLLEKWKKGKDYSGIFKIKKNPNLELTKNEKILIPECSCVIEIVSILSQEYFATNIIVTNKRLITGTTILPNFLEIKFGYQNIWKKSIENIPKLGVSKWQSLNLKPKNLFLGKSEAGEYLEIGTRYGGIMPVIYRVYSKNARKIMQILSKL